MVTQGVLQLKELADNLAVCAEIGGSAYGLESEVQKIFPYRIAIDEARRLGASR